MNNTKAQNIQIDQDDHWLTNIESILANKEPLYSNDDSIGTPVKFDLDGIFNDQDLNTSFTELNLTDSNYTLNSFSIFHDSADELQSDPLAIAEEPVSTLSATTLHTSPSPTSQNTSSPLTSLQGHSLNKIKTKCLESVPDVDLDSKPNSILLPLQSTSLQQLSPISTSQASIGTPRSKKKSYGSLIPTSTSKRRIAHTPMRSEGISESRAFSQTISSSKKKTTLGRGGITPTRLPVRNFSHTFETPSVLQSNNSDDEEDDERDISQTILPSSRVKSPPLAQRRSRRLMLQELDPTPRSPGRRCTPRHLELQPGKSVLKVTDPENLQEKHSTVNSLNSSTNSRLPVGFYSQQDLLRREAQEPVSLLPKTPKTPPRRLRKVNRQMSSAKMAKKHVVWASTLEW